MIFRACKVTQGNSGYALIASMLVMFLLTGFGLLALVTSTSELRIIQNLSEDEAMFGYGEQGIDRILSHLHYLPQGLFGPVKREGLGRTMDDLTAFQVWSYDDKIFDLYLGRNWDPGELPVDSPVFRMQAYMDLENLRTPGEGHADPFDSSDPRAYLDIGLSRKVAISVSVRNDRTGYEKAFRAIIEPQSIWDMAYFSQNHTPIAREGVSGCTTGDTSAQTWYDCQTVFHNEDTIIGDAYFRDSLNERDTYHVPDDGRMFVRGGPQLSGRIQWRHMNGYGKHLQTAGGSGASAPVPSSTKGMHPRSKELSIFPPNYLSSGSVAWFYEAADIQLEDRGNTCGTSNNSQCIWKIIFRNDYDWDNDSIYEESRMASRITFEINNGVSEDPVINIASPSAGDPGAFVLYSLPFTTSSEKRAAYYGNVGSDRHNIMTHAQNGGEIYTPAVSWANSVVGGCTFYRNNQDAVSATLKPFDENDIRPTQGYDVFLTPSVGLNLGSFGGTGNCPSESSGIIFVDGDVLVSGVHDGKTTIVASGDIILDHEVQYEEHPSNFYTTAGSVRQNPHDIDMLGLFTLQNIVIPNSYPQSSRPADCAIFSLNADRCAFYDDWSDPSGSGSASGLFVPRGEIDLDPISDDGNEEIHAVMVSFGRICTGKVADGSIDCPAITPTAAEITNIQNFNVGIYATPRTADGLPRGAFWGGTWNEMGNNSGRLTVYGSMIQYISGRVGYDHVSSSCTSGLGEDCRHMGHTLVVNYDSHLKYSIPAMPFYMGATRGIPYGLAAWEIQSWERIDLDDIGKDVF